MTIFGPDASKWQGNVNWSQVDRSMAFGWEKVTEGTAYVSERWGPEKPEMRARARASGFIPGGYLFLAQGNGAAQADYFADHAGDMADFAIAVDVEPREPGSHPAMADARACVARLRARYPGHPIGGYIPRWYWGSKDTSFVDYLWSSNYVTGGPASPEWLYSRVTPAQWAGYGGTRVSLLQFTDKAQIPGVSGPCDCSAFRGTAAELRALVLPRGAAAAKPPTTTEAPVALKRVWIGSPNFSTRGGTKVRLIVLHTTEGAQSYQALGSFFGSQASQVSSHVGIDDTPNTVGEYVKRGAAAWTSAGANLCAVQGEFCTPSGAALGWNRAMWMGKHHQMLVNAAQWIKEEAAHFGIPITALTAQQAQGSGRGVCEHKHLGSWGGGHVDCGPGFPLDYVISLARGASPVVTTEVGLMQPAYLAKGEGAKTPIVIPAGAKRLRFFAHRDAQVHIDLIGEKQPAKDDLVLGYDKGAQQVVLGQALAVVVTRVDAGEDEVSFVASA